jgi:hypothetical protein
MFLIPIIRNIVPTGIPCDYFISKASYYKQQLWLINTVANFIICEFALHIESYKMFSFIVEKILLLKLHDFNEPLIWKVVELLENLQI